MKSKIFFLVFITSFILSGCSSNTKSADMKDVPASNVTTATNTPTKVITDNPAATDTPSVTATVSPSPTITETPAITVTVAPVAKVHKYLDYSDHTVPDEASYRTVLADPKKLKYGKPVFALRESVMADLGVTFNGFNKQKGWGYDVRSCDISKENLSKVDNLNYLSFDSSTVWPKKLPKGFDPEQILEFNKNPGLGIRALHDKGIIGSNVGIAIIDQPLLLEHEEYKDNVMYYERIHCEGSGSSMHGPAVASIAVGKTIGVAPGAKLYYIAITNGHEISDSYDYDYSVLADAILRVLNINKNLPANKKIRVISISLGYDESEKGYDDFQSAMDKANAQNIFVLTTTTDKYYDFKLFGMNRDYTKDPDNFNSYSPTDWAAENFYLRPELYQNMILFPITRTYAASTGIKNYEINREGGLSWAVPWCAGFYALCCQVKPQITPEKFSDIIRSTAVTTKIKHDGETYDFGGIINPAAVIDKLKHMPR